MVMAARALQRESKERSTHGGGAIDRVFHEVFSVNGPALVTGDMRTIKSAGDLLLHRAIGHEVTRHLFNHKLVVWHVVTEGGKHPIAPQPHLSTVVLMNAAGIRVARHIKPRNRHAFGVSASIRFLSQQPIDQYLVGIGTLIGEERSGLFRSGRKSSEIQEDAAAQRGAISFRVWCDGRTLKRGKNEIVDRCPRPSNVMHRGNSGHRRHGERPMRFVQRALGDPLPKHRLFIPAERMLATVRWRHDDVRVD